MAFNANDIYVAGGKSKIFNTWTAGVRKFDSTSFYNWEQDNVPLYDLEDRSYYLWEKAGWPASSIDGLIYTVSADASGHVVDYITGETALGKDSNIFLDVSSAIAALPSVIRFPIRIEIANMGRVGSLNLHNIKCEGNGALEILNLPFSRLSMHTTDVSGTTEGSAVFVDQVSSTDLATMLSPAVGGISALDLSATLCSSTYDIRYNGLSQMFLQHPGEISNSDSLLRRTSNLTTLFDVTRDADNPNMFTGTVYSKSEDPTATTYDMSSITHDGGGVMSRAGFKEDSTLHQRAVGFFYANYFDSVSVKNCVGPIYIRNAQVNGTDMSVTGDSLGTYTTEVGFDILNSEVVLENCVAWRCNRAGINIDNSKVTLSRGCIAYRNYFFQDRSSIQVSGGLAYGLKASNSDINLSGGPVNYGASGADFVNSFTTNQNGIYCYNSTITGGAPSALAAVSGVASLQCYINDKTGLTLENSNIFLSNRLETWQNTTGIKALNSKINSNELRVEYNQDTGMELDNSQYVYGSNNQYRTVPGALNHTLLTSGLETGTATTATGYGLTYDYPGQVHFAWNKQHMNLNNSKFTHPSNPWNPTSNLWNIGRCKYKMGFGRVDLGTDGEVPVTIPSIVLNNNSSAKLFQASIYSEGLDTAQLGPDQIGTFASVTPSGDYRAGTGAAQYGSCVLARNNSRVDFEGTGDFVTNIQGPVTLPDQKYNALVYASNNSIAKFSGPTLIMRGGVDVLAEDNSKMIFGPQTYKDTDLIDRAGFALSAESNHTKVDLHSTRACLVANRSSEIILENLGSYAQAWSTQDSEGNMSGSSVLTSADYCTAETSGLTKGGHLQFYPNPQLVDNLVAINPSADPKNLFVDPISLPLHDAIGTTAPASGEAGIYAITNGGVCLRACEGSKILAKNINFPAGWNNCSAIYYNYGSDDFHGCAQLRIWNIDDSSELDASYLSVSSHFPRDAGYTGPSAVYVSGDPIGGDGSGTASGAPSSTPHTNTLSVLDSFGLSGTAQAQNFGPFRLYFSPLGPAKWLVYAPKTLVDGEVMTTGFDPSATGQIYQTLAQGYNPSATCSALPSTVSALDAIYTSGPTAPWYIFGALHTSALSGLVMPNGEDWYYTTDATPNRGDPRAPSFFYVKDMLPRDYYGRIRLDESGMETFANAKNGTLGTSGRIRLVSFYSSKTFPAGESAESNTDGYGKGFLSASIFDLGKQN